MSEIHNSFEFKYLSMLFWACLVYWNLQNSQNVQTLPSLLAEAQLHQAGSIEHRKVSESKTIMYLTQVWYVVGHHLRWSH